MNATAQLTVGSTTVRDGHTVPDSMVFEGMGCTGGDTSPDLQWSGAPAGTKSFAVTMYDPDAPTTVGFVHWVLFDIPADATGIAAGAGGHKHGGVGTHGVNDFGLAKYSGPCPPPGDAPHHYQITVYALDVTELAGLDHTTSFAKFMFTAREHVLATGRITGLYGR